MQFFTLLNLNSNSNSIVTLSSQKKNYVPYGKIWQKLLKATAFSGLPGQAELDRVAPLVADPSRRNSTKSKHKHK